VAGSCSQNLAKNPDTHPHPPTPIPPAPQLLYAEPRDVFPVDLMEHSEGANGAGEGAPAS
jgi:hypothetical protein